MQFHRISLIYTTVWWDQEIEQFLLASLHRPHFANEFSQLIVQPIHFFDWNCFHCKNKLWGFLNESKIMQIPFNPKNIHFYSMALLIWIKKCMQNSLPLSLRKNISTVWTMYLEYYVLWKIWLNISQTEQVR